MSCTADHVDNEQLARAHNVESWAIRHGYAFHYNVINPEDYAGEVGQLGPSSHSDVVRGYGRSAVCQVQMRCKMRQRSGQATHVPVHAHVRASCPRIMHLRQARTMTLRRAELLGLRDLLPSVRLAGGGVLPRRPTSSPSVG